MGNVNQPQRGKGYSAGRMEFKTNQNTSGTIGNGSATDTITYDGPSSGHVPSGRSEYLLMTTEMVKRSSFHSYDFNTVWTIEEGKTYPYLKGLPRPEEVVISPEILENMIPYERGRYVIYNPEHMKYMRYKPSGNFLLANNIDLKGIAWEEYMPGTDNYPFSGIFDGNNYTIRNINIKKMDNDKTYYGLFAIAENATIKDLTLKDIDYEGIAVGGVVGGLGSSNVSNCHITGNSRIKGRRLGGGITAGSKDSNISNCGVYATITVDSAYAGGIAAQTTGGGIQDSFFIGDIINYESEQNILGASGGIVGYRVSERSDWIERCYSMGTIRSKGPIGGIVGQYSGFANHAVIVNCFSTMDIIAEPSLFGGSANHTCAGGLVGDITYYSYIKNCYFGGTIQAKDESIIIDGLFAKYKAINGHDFSSCYYDKEKTGIEGDALNARTTQEMYTQENYVNWDFTTTWLMPKNSYPVFIGFRNNAGN